MTRNMENYREWKRINYLKNRDKELERKRKYHETKEGKESLKRNNKLAWERNKEKVSARKKLIKAVQSGKIERKPCEVCGIEQVDGHHEDYSKPLEVKWLCRKHHMELHRGSRANTDGRYNW